MHDENYFDAVADILGHESMDTTRTHYAFALEEQRPATIEENVVEQRAVSRARPSPAQIVAIVVGLAFIVIGAVALAHAGL